MLSYIFKDNSILPKHIKKITIISLDFVPFKSVTTNLTLCLMMTSQEDQKDAQ